MASHQAPYLEMAEPGKPVVAARVAAVAAPNGSLLPSDGVYWAKSDETCHKIGKMFGVEPHVLVELNRERYGTALLSSSKLKKDTSIVLPQPEIRWILTKQFAKFKPEGKKKHKYSVQDIDAAVDQIYPNIEGYRVQDYPQLSNSYVKDEVVCALFPNVVGDAEGHVSAQWFTEFYPAIYMYAIPSSNPPRAMLKFENDQHSLDHTDASLKKSVPLCVIIKREKARKRDEDDDEGAKFESNELRMCDPKYPEIGMRKFLWDSMTEYWHDSLDFKRKLKFKCREPAGAKAKVIAPKEPTRRKDWGGDEKYIEDDKVPRYDGAPEPPKSPTRWTEDQVRNTLLAHGLFVLDMSFEDPPPPLAAVAADVESGAAAEGGDGGDVAMQDACQEVAEGAGAVVVGGVGEQEDAMEEEEEIRLPHMQWTYKDNDGKNRNWTATRAIDCQRQPAPYLVLW